MVKIYYTLFTSLLFAFSFYQVNAQTLGTPEIDSVTVKTVMTPGGSKQFAEITWLATVEINRDSYFIYKNLSPVFITLDSVLSGQNSFLYQDAKLATAQFTNSKCETEKETFNVLASHFDNKFNSLFSNPHSTIYLSETSFDQCSQNITLNWNSYEGWTQGVRTYRIYLSQGGNSFTLIDSVNTNTYTFNNLLSGVDNRFFIRAVASDNSKTSSSNIKTYLPSFGTFPNFVYAYDASVADNNDTIKVSWIADPSTSPIKYTVERSKTTSNFLPVATLSQPGNFQFLYFETEKNVNEVYYYRIVAQTNCPVSTITSEVLNTVVLTAKTNPDFSNLLSWNLVKGWENGAQQYDLYRNGTLLISLPDGVTSYLDSDTAIILNKTVNCYKIIAREVASSLGTNGIAQSNTNCAFPKSNIFVPDAFSPGGKNPIFKPVLIGIDQKEYSFKIFDRWGRMIFSTNNQENGWDGDIASGNIISTGVYIYLINAKKLNGDSITKKGTVIAVF